jgi:transcriptional regulator GlxA family with amidase domain
MEILIDISFQSQAQIPMELGQAMRLMEFGMSQRISVCEISQTIGVSPIRLRHLFLEHTGMLPKQYQLKFRMQHAYSLLRNQKLSVAETANKVGYVNASVFIREFRNFFGKTPLDVTKQ